MTEDRLERLEEYVQSYSDLCIVRHSLYIKALS
jgi:hypothetical protein